MKAKEELVGIWKGKGKGKKGGIRKSNRRVNIIEVYYMYT
jgi:hypothetical protein